MEKITAIKKWIKSTLGVNAFLGVNASKNTHLLLVTLGCFLFGIFLLLLQRNWLIIRWVPGYERAAISFSSEKKHRVQRKEVALYYWKDEKIKKEVDSCIWREGGKNSLLEGDNIKLVVGNWLSFLYEERVLRKRVGLQSVAICDSEQELLMSFDQAFFARGWSIRSKWQFLDGLCRTIGGLGLQIQSVLFLVNHEEMSDDHLDFS